MIGILAALQGGIPPSRAEPSRSEAAPPSETSTMAAFIARVRRDPQLRARFAQSPRTILREQGIDPAPFDLPDQLDDIQLERLLADWSRRAGPPAVTPPQPLPSPPVAVYGPPPGLQRGR
jgi:hypothetical protein